MANYSIMQVANATTDREVSTSNSAQMTNENGSTYINVRDTENENAKTAIHVLYVANKPEIDALKVGDYFLCKASYNVSKEGEVLNVQDVEKVNGVLSAKSMLKSLGEGWTSISRSKEATKETILANDFKTSFRAVTNVIRAESSPKEDFKKAVLSNDIRKERLVIQKYRFSQDEIDAMMSEFATKKDVQIVEKQIATEKAVETKEAKKAVVQE